MKHRILIMLATALMISMAFGMAAGLALTETAFEINADQLDMDRVLEGDYIEENLAAKAQYISISYLVEGEQQVTISVSLQETGEAVYQKNYGSISGNFTSDDIYLKYTDSQTVPYTITLKVGAEETTFPFLRQLMMLQRNNACTYGVRMQDVQPNLTKRLQMGTALDLEAIRSLPGSRVEIPLCASSKYVIGTVTVRVRDDNLRISMAFVDGLDITMHRQAMYLFTHPGRLTSLGERDLDHLHQYQVGTDVSILKDLKGADKVILYLPMEVTYDPNGLAQFTYDLAGEENLQNQLIIWQELLEKETVQDVETVG